MIRFSLVCAEAHEFEGWFANSDAFEKQKLGALLECPVCGTTSVDKALMAPALASPAEAPAPVRVAAHVPEPDVLAMLRQLRKKITENADYVGGRFAEEARRIHYEEAEKRGIYGEATREEVRALAEEGIDFHPLPLLPEDRN